jgi:hypothetical protein
VEKFEKQSGSVPLLSNISVEDRNTRSADGQQTATRQHESPAASTSFVTLPVRRWPPPPAPDKGMLSGCEVLTWLAFGDSRRRDNVGDFVDGPFEFWGVGWR